MRIETAARHKTPIQNTGNQTNIGISNVKRTYIIYTIIIQFSMTFFLSVVRNTFVHDITNKFINGKINKTAINCE